MHEKKERYKGEEDQYQGEQGCMLKSIIVKNFDETKGKRNQKDLWRYRALVGGFYIFKHEYIFIFNSKDPHRIPLEHKLGEGWGILSVLNYVFFFLIFTPFKCQ